MPKGVVKPGQEALWEKAKDLAAAQGHAGNWAYVNGIFQDLKKGARRSRRSKRRRRRRQNG